MKYKVKLTVIDKKLYPELQQEHCFNPQSGTGKHNKWLLRFLTKDECIDVLKTYRLESIEICWESLEIAMRLFDKAMKEVCNYFNYNDPDDFIRVKNYIETLKTLK